MTTAICGTSTRPSRRSRATGSCRCSIPQDQYNQLCQGEGFPPGPSRTMACHRSPSSGSATDYVGIRRSSGRPLLAKPGPGRVGLQDRYAAAWPTWRSGSPELGRARIRADDVAGADWPGQTLPQGASVTGTCDRATTRAPASGTGRRAVNAITAPPRYPTAGPRTRDVAVTRVATNTADARRHRGERVLARRGRDAARCEGSGSEPPPEPPPTSPVAVRPSRSRPATNLAPNSASGKRHASAPT